MRDVNTYRSNRRNEWHSLIRDVPWSAYNKHGGSKYQIGSLRAPLVVGHVARSKYMPHIGKKQREKGAQA